MANRAIHQEPFTSNREDDDVFMIDRGTSTLKIRGANMAPAIRVAQVTIPSADVLTMFTTPVQVIPPADAGTVIVPMRGLIEFANGTVNYATNTILNLSASDAPTSPVLVGRINDRLQSNYPTNAAVFGPPAIDAGIGLVATTQTGNPTAGDSDLTITVRYYVFNTP